MPVAQPLHHRAGLLAIAVLAAACQVGAPYFSFASRIGQGVPIGVGDRAYVLVWAFQPPKDDVIELVGLELVDADADNLTITPLAFDTSTVEGDAIGIVLADDPRGAAAAIAALRPLAGFTYRSRTTVDDLHVIVEVEATASGIATIGAYRLSFTVNGGSAQSVLVPSALVVCVDDPAPARCDVELEP